nr:MAG TPA: hypothetical protein [Bacteriophage sp.]
MASLASFNSFFYSSVNSPFILSTTLILFN